MSDDNSSIGANLSTRRLTTFMLSILVFEFCRLPYRIFSLYACLIPLSNDVEYLYQALKSKAGELCYVTQWMESVYCMPVFLYFTYLFEVEDNDNR